MAKKLNLWIYANLIFTFISGILLIYYGIEVLKSGKVWDFIFGKVFQNVNSFAPENQTIISIIDKFFNIRFDPSDFWIGIFLILIGVTLILLATILIIPEKNIIFKKLKNPNEFIKNRKTFNIVLVLIFLSSISYLYKDFNEPISRIHSFKQAEVASNIYFYVEDGFTIEEYLLNKNEELKIFSYPFYQWSVAGFSILSGIDIEKAGRLINIFIFSLSFLVFYKLLKILKLNELSIILTLLLFSFSSLTLYFYRAVHPDPLAILFMFISIYLFIKYESENKFTFYILSLFAGIIVCLIKSPIYLIGFTSIIVYRFYIKSFKTLFKKDFLIYSFIIFGTVLFYKFSTDAINGGVHLPSEVTFGTIAQRFQIVSYFYLTLWNAFEVTNPLFAIVAVFGVVITARNLKNQKDKSEILFFGMFLGWLAAIIVFFHVFQRHDYYHLPIILMTSYFIVKGFTYLLTKFERSNKIRSSLISFCIIVIFIFINFLGLSLLKLPTKPDTEVFQTGKFIQKNISKKDFLFYTMSIDEQSWDPTYLFHCRRNGFNISLQNVKREKYIDSIINRCAKPFENIYLFAPTDYYKSEPVLFDKYEVYKEFEMGKIFKIK